MKASLYEVVTVQGAAQVVPTLHLASDLAVWLAKPEVKGLRLLCDSLSWSRAWKQANAGEAAEAATFKQRRIPFWDKVRFHPSQDEEKTAEPSAAVDEAASWYTLSNVPRERIGLSGAQKAVCRKMARLMQGRSLFPEEFKRLLQDHDLIDEAEEWQRWTQLLYLTGAVRLACGIHDGVNGKGVSICRKLFRRIKGTAHHGGPYCLRCGSSGDDLQRTPCAACGDACWYCKGCLTMGRSRSCSVLIIGNSLPASQHGQAVPVQMRSLESWGLSPAQTEAVQSGLAFIERTAALSDKAKVKTPIPGFLIWAVTGAGKTEMIYPLIEAVLSTGGRVAVATPRRDVVLELSPRMNKAFPAVNIATLYGGSDEGWLWADLILATTHQLLRFEQAFELVIIDELDAFPYHNDPKLAYAARKSLKPDGKMIFLSATPPKELQRQVKRGVLDHVRVPVRFHRYPLPVPMHYTIPAVKQWCGGRQIPDQLKRMLHMSVDRGAQVFVFVAAIRLVEPVVGSLRRVFPHIRVEGTSSVDQHRGDKVMEFRESHSRILVTTTILERGVTIPKSDVFILDADSSLFDEASLVQMAGRAGRSPLDPQGKVYFFSSARTRSQQGAVRQIERMNQIAAKKGYLRNEDMESTV
ncbi:DEAD/DEAH box helicase [Marinicrinis lubricantis]|uniref:DEAD/DEAH box helicase n=1 Tax=Marinicrinis lubricantis TaxID=2086470 RepID=A0ABW1ISV1_9BACL